MEFSRQEYWKGLLFPTPEDLLTQGLNLCLLHRQADSLPLQLLGNPETEFFFFSPNIHGGALSLFISLFLLGLVSEISVNKYFTFFPHYFFLLYSGIIF